MFFHEDEFARFTYDYNMIYFCLATCKKTSIGADLLCMLSEPFVMREKKVGIMRNVRKIHQHRYVKQIFAQGQIFIPVSTQISQDLSLF
jgi:hypothetical protein